MAASKSSSLAARLVRASRNPEKVAGHLLNGLYRWAADGDNRPVFYDIDKTCPSLRLLDRNFEVIRDEMESVLRYKGIPRYHEITERERYISGTVDPDKDWKVFMLYGANQTRCPRTSALIEKIPNVLQAFFSILDPGKSIPAHCGPYLGYLRYHLGLRVPQKNPPSIRIRDQRYTWKEGQSIIFDDSWEHEVYNKSDDLRVVLIVDFFRPMPLPVHVINWGAMRLIAPYTEEAKLARSRIEKYSNSQ